MKLNTTEIANFERSVSPSNASVQIEEVASKIEKKFHIKLCHYKKGHTDIVYAINADGKEITYGLGKGKFSRLGAYGECIEHYFYDKIGHAHSESVIKSIYLKLPEASEDSILRYALTLPGAPDRLSCLQYTIENKNDKRLVPSIYLNYRFLEIDDLKKNIFKKFLTRYVTTSGTAFGLTEDDAFLHALHETVERDITSNYLIKLMSNDAHDDNFEEIKFSTMPKHIKELLHDRNDSGEISRIQIIIKKTRFKSWWSMCIVESKDKKIFLPQWGAGSSLLYDLAIYRSVSEAVQMLDNYELENSTADQEYIKFCHTQKKLKNMTRFFSNNLRKIDYNNKNNIQGLTIKKQIKQLTTSMNSCGYFPSRHVVYSNENVCIVSSYTPELERFYNITKSVPVLPIYHVKGYLNRVQPN